MKHCANEQCPDLVDLGRPGEYLDEVEACPMCGVVLVADPAPVSPPPEWCNLAVVGSYTEYSSAELARSRLEQEGIRAVLKDQYTVGINWLYSNAIGGVKVCVPLADAERAREVLMHSEAEVLEPSPFPPPDHEELCPACGSEEVHPGQLAKRSLALSMLVRVPFVLGRHRWYCGACGYRWDSRHPRREVESKAAELECPFCKRLYSPCDYRSDASEWLCTGCQRPLPKNVNKRKHR